MDVQKRPSLHLLNILMACLGVVAGGLMICQLLLTLAAPSLQSAGGADLPEESVLLPTGRCGDQQRHYGLRPGWAGLLESLP